MQYTVVKCRPTTISAILPIATVACFQWLLVIELMSRTGKPLSELVAERIAAYPSSGEVNFRLEDPQASIAKVIAAFEGTAEGRDETDGISLIFRGLAL